MIFLLGVVMVIPIGSYSIVQMLSSVWLKRTKAYAEAKAQCAKKKAAIKSD